jgi:RNA recognition motif-containing protein
VNEADLAVSSLNYRGGILVARFTDEQHLRFMRSYELTIDDPPDSASLRQRYAQYGDVYQAWVDPRFSVGFVQFYQKRTADLASGPAARFTSEKCVLVFRDLSFEVTDEQLLSLCRPFGSVRNLISRDINPLMRFLIKEVTFSSSAEAKAAKKALATRRIGENAVRTAILNGGRVDAFDWKMAQRKQWVLLRGVPMTRELFQHCRRLGTVRDVRVIDGDSFVMFKEVETALAFPESETPSLCEFVEKLNPDELEFDSIEEETSAAEEPRKMAIVVDDLAPGTTEAQILGFCGEFAAVCVAKVTKSLKFAGRERAVLFPQSRSSTKKIYRCLNEVEIDGVRLQPVRMKREDVSEPPDIEGPAPVRPAKKPKGCLVVDPVPVRWTPAFVASLCGEFLVTGSARIERSGLEVGRQRLVVEIGNGKPKKQIIRLMNEDLSAENRCVVTLDPPDLPPPIEVLDATAVVEIPSASLLG